MGQLVSAAAAAAAEDGPEQSQGGEIPEEFCFVRLRNRPTSNKPARARIKKTCVNPGNKPRM